MYVKLKLLNIYLVTYNLWFSDMQKTRFGIDDDYQIAVNSLNVSGVWKNVNSLIIASSNGIHLTNNKRIIQTLPTKFSVSTEIWEYNLIAGFSANSGELFILSKTDLAHPLLMHFQTGQKDVQQLIHITNSRLLVAIGNPTKAWNLNFFNSSISLSSVGTITESFDVFTFNSISENIYFKKGTSILMSDFHSHINPAFECDEDTIKIEICNSTQTFILYQVGCIYIKDREGKFLGSIETPRIEFSFLKFINHDFLIAADKNNDIYLFDVNVMKLITTYHFNKRIDQLFLISKGLAISSGPNLYVKKLVLPYRFWTKLSTNPVLIKRCNKKKIAARIMIFTKDNNVLMYSPKTNEVICSTNTNGSNAVFYDRGLFLEYLTDGKLKFVDTNINTDRLFASTWGDGMTVYDTSSENCLAVAKIDFNGTAIAICEYHDQWAYCVATPEGELVFFTMVGYCEMDRVFLDNKRCIDLLYHHRTHSIYAVYTNEINRFDFRARRIVESIAVESNEVAKIHGDFLIVGFRNGTIQPFIIHEFQTFPIETPSNKTFHSNSVTGFSFAPKFFVSSSKDCTIKYWDYSFNLLYEILLPFPILTCELLNGKRHVLIGIEKGVLFVSGYYAFGDEADIYESYIDSFDLLDDDLRPKNLMIKSLNDENQDHNIQDDISQNVEIKEIIVQNHSSYLTEAKKTLADTTPIEKPKLVKPPKTEGKKPARKKKRKSTTSSSLKQIKSPRKVQEKEIKPLIKNTPPPIPSYKPSPRYVKPIGSSSSLTRTKVIEQPNKSWTEVFHRVQNNQRPAIQAHIFDFNADNYFGNDSGLSSSRGFNPSYAPKKKNTTQIVKIKRVTRY
ncbi:hypothetical protein TRFO_26148 [Tritrichomonas foetus]|uniref:Uncharacterized protein n=1 Tax=Tritrichomonas foetus TaxID=1144522 RepID=A0A1J4K4P0_9EUKA|nr:hypothetical protein TRFO_26148 [Tritrichomonas foetus]|eukprot:OHT05938.1 hypothetical protein TRFO_26148 [Tritrichomonas foetus]